MKIAYFGCDLFIQCLDILQSHGHDIVAIFVANTDDNITQLSRFSEVNKISLFTEKPDKQQIKQLEADGVECFFSIEYNYLIPLPSPRVMTINMHPTMLPHGRGPTPLGHLILQYPQYAGISFHKLVESFDQGDIILQSPIQLDSNEGLDSLLNKLHIKIAEMLDELLTDLPQLYQQATAQGKGSYWPALTDQDRLLNWHNSTKEIAKCIRAFGRFGVVCCIGQEIWLVKNVETRVISHSLTAGSVLEFNDKTCTVATTDGIVIIYTDSIIERKAINT